MGRLFNLPPRDRNLPRWGKLLLATLRAGVVLLLVCIFLGPALIYLQERKIHPSVVVLRDASQSMNTADDYPDEAAAKMAAAALGKSPDEVKQQKPTRVEIVNHLFSSGDGKLLRQLAEKGKIQLFDFAEQATKVDLTATPFAPKQSPPAATQRNRPRPPS